MLSYALRRILVAIVLVWVVATILFSLLHVIPGDPAMLLSSSGGVLPSPEVIEALREQMGLNRPVWEQYSSYIVGILQGNLGVSFQDGYPVAPQDCDPSAPHIGVDYRRNVAVNRSRATYRGLHCETTGVYH